MKATYHIPYIKTEVGAPVAPALPKPEYTVDKESFILSWKPVPYATSYRYEDTHGASGIVEEPVQIPLPLYAPYTCRVIAENPALISSEEAVYEYPTPVADLSTVLDYMYINGTLLWTPVRGATMYEVTLWNEGVGSTYRLADTALEVNLDLYDSFEITSACWGHYSISRFKLHPQLNPLCITAITNADILLYVDDFVEGAEPFNIQAKVNDGDWEAFSIPLEDWFKQYHLDEGDRLYIRGFNSVFNSQQHGRFRIGTYSFDGNKVSLSGDITSLLNGYGEVDDLTPYGDRVFRNLFDNSNGAQGLLQIESAKDLILPSTILAEYCYSNLFRHGTLVEAPALPATTLAPYCYNYMFNGCPNLISAPDLPATTLADHCYFYMFSGCTSLTTAPELPATTLAPYCYNAMFDKCTSLEKAPELPATELTDFCYAYMFRDCTNLNEIKVYATQWTSAAPFNRFTYGVTSEGIFYTKITDHEWLRQSGIAPKNFTIVNF